MLSHDNFRCSAKGVMSAGCWLAIEVIEMIAEGALSMYILDSLILARQKLGTRAVGWGIVPSSTHCRRQHDE